MVTSKRKFDFEGSYLKRLGESIALLLHIRPHKVRLDPTSIKNPMLRLDCAGTLPPRACCQQPSRPVVHQRERSTRCPRRRPRAAQAGQKVCGDGTVAGVRRRARRTRAADGQSVPAREPRERAQKELAVTRCRAVVMLWRLCTVGKVRLQQGSTMVVPCCSLA